ncbi:hypothetical protein DRW07_14495 [Alteromonas sediminis]|uniref:Protein nucleotidyltransferase YdiU n=1 Tax=Alteromonas sediminis TaxID=2259342 RepID=A0A3N5XYE8_9ALTE|nr:protein adenylyltransferase SelO family protein [Alteromonas sediminis]RPJ66012.1 hypothetical protein DRW07_14495 [Alteromonas sediminis]
MANAKPATHTPLITDFGELAAHADYSLLNTLNADPESTESGDDYYPRQVFSGHYVPVKPTPLNQPVYVAHSATLFNELGFDERLVQTDAFTQFFSGDVSNVPASMKQYGWATGYALSIYGTEYTEQCPFRTGNGYGDGRAISVLEAVLNNQRWEMQLKGAGRTPYCRGADGRAVLRSSVREFLAQEHMHALHVPTSRSLSLYVSKTETVERPWYFEGSQSADPEIMVSNPVAITTRVAPSFLRVGQLELFGRRTRKNEYPEARHELEMIVKHLIEREYATVIDRQQPLQEQVLQLAAAFRDRLTSLVADWVRVGFCQGNFNADNCAGGGFTLDYGPFGFCEMFDPVYQPWTGGGRHFAFLNQPVAAEKNFGMFCSAVSHLMNNNQQALDQLSQIRLGFSEYMDTKMANMWAAKLGLDTYHSDLVMQLLRLMVKTSVDYTIFFRELSNVPTELAPLEKSFYAMPDSSILEQWNQWLESWHVELKKNQNNGHLSERMKKVNPKYTWREWLIVPAYQQAASGNFTLIEELQQVLNHPYDEQSADVESKFYCKRPNEFLYAGGISHYSCSS